MTDRLPPLRLTGARVLAEGRFHDAAVTLADGLIAEGPAPDVDLSGYLVLPGIVDLHGDGFERHVAPRPGALFPLVAALSSVDREAAAQGVTTAYLAQGWSWEGGHRSPDYAERFLAAVADFRPYALADLRVQLRVETHMTASADRLVAAVTTYGVGYVVFNDHLAEGLAMERDAPRDFALWSRKVGRTAEEMSAVLGAASAEGPAVPAHLDRLSAAFRAGGVVFGSHDDPDPATRDAYHARGAAIAEFPTTRAAAERARALGNPVLMGAPNVVRGGSQAGNIAAADLVALGLCDGLVSDYHLPALSLAAWSLVDLGLCDLAAAWSMISDSPARTLGLSDRGRIAPGLRADLVVVDPDTRRIEATIADGRLAYLSGAAGRRFLAAGPVAA